MTKGRVASTQPRNQKKPRAGLPRLIFAAQTICKSTRAKEQRTRHRPDGLATLYYAHGRTDSAGQELGEWLRIFRPVNEFEDANVG